MQSRITALEKRSPSLSEAATSDFSSDSSSESSCGDDTSPSSPAADACRPSSGDASRSEMPPLEAIPPAGSDADKDTATSRTILSLPLAVVTDSGSVIHFPSSPPSVKVDLGDAPAIIFKTDASEFTSGASFIPIDKDTVMGEAVPVPSASPEAATVEASSTS